MAESLIMTGEETLGELESKRTYIQTLIKQSIANKGEQSLIDELQRQLDTVDDAICDKKNNTHYMEIRRLTGELESVKEGIEYSSYLKRKLLRKKAKLINDEIARLSEEDFNILQELGIADMKGKGK